MVGVNMKVENINIKILKELSTKMPEMAEKARQNFTKYDRWVSGEDYPTYNQLVELSKIFHIPFGYFFLEKLPERKYPIPHYRTIKNDLFFPSNELLDTVLFAQKIQEWAKYILLKWGQETIPFCGKYKNEYNKEKIIEELKTIFDIKNNWASEKKTWTEAFNYLKEKAEQKGIIVLVNGIVGNNTHRKLDVKEFRGFVLYDDIAPVIFINNNDAISAKIFTLIHEIVHILIGESASFDLRNFQSAEDEIEKFCDVCTAEFLVPSNELIQQYQKTTNLEELARQFKVSHIVILRRLLDIETITQNEFYEQLNNLYDKEIKGEQKSGGGNFYAIECHRLSKRFLNILNNAFHSNIIFYRDMLRITGLKAKTFNKLIKEWI